MDGLKGHLQAKTHPKPAGRRCKLDRTEGRSSMCWAGLQLMWGAYSFISEVIN